MSSAKPQHADTLGLLAGWNRSSEYRYRVPRADCCSVGPSSQVHGQAKAARHRCPALLSRHIRRLGRCGRSAKGGAQVTLAPDVEHSAHVVAQGKSGASGASRFTVIDVVQKKVGARRVFQRFNARCCTGSGPAAEVAVPAAAPVRSSKLKWVIAIAVLSVFVLLWWRCALLRRRHVTALRSNTRAGSADAEQRVVSCIRCWSIGSERCGSTAARRRGSAVRLARHGASDTAAGPYSFALTPMTGRL